MGQLINIFKDLVIINESIASAKKRFLDTNKITQEEFNNINKIDFTNTKKYIEKMIQFYLDGNEDLNRLENIFKIFDKNINKLDKKDINQYKSIDELENVLSNISVTKMKNNDKCDTSEIKYNKESVIYKDSRWLILRPRTKQEAIEFGRGYSYCISRSDKNNKFLEYTLDNDNTFYFIFDKSVPISHPFHLQILDYSSANTHDSITVWDSDNDEHNYTINAFFKKFKIPKNIQDVIIDDMKNYRHELLKISDKLDKSYNNITEDDFNYLVDLIANHNMMREVTNTIDLDYILQSSSFKLKPKYETLDKLPDTLFNLIDSNSSQYMIDYIIQNRPKVINSIILNWYVISNIYTKKGYEFYKKLNIDDQKKLLKSTKGYYLNSLRNTKHNRNKIRDGFNKSWLSKYISIGD